MQTPKVFSLILLFLLMACGQLGWTAEPAQAETPAAHEQATEPALDVSSLPPLEQGIRLGTEYLLRHCGANGKFVYVTHPQPEKLTISPDKYNLLRHAGTIYALTMVYERSPDERVRDAIVRAAGYLKTHTAPVEAWPGALAVWTSPGELGHDTADDPSFVKLGANGLALIALARAYRLGIETVPLDDLRGLANFILRMQKKDGSFASKFVGDEADDDWTSLYYPGEAMLGLLELNRIDPNPEWTRCAVRAAGFLTLDRVCSGKYPDDHWFLLALELLMPQWESLPEHPVMRAHLVEHVEKICTQMLDRLILDPSAANYGAFNWQGSTCPSAIRLEGLLATTNWTDNQELRKRIEVAGRIGCGFLLRSQLRDGELQGGIPRAIAPSAMPTPSAALDRWNRRVGEIRIDYVQHALSAMLRQSAAQTDSP